MYQDYKAGAESLERAIRSKLAATKMADEFKRTANVYELIRCYAQKQEMCKTRLHILWNLKKKIAVEKKAVRENIKKYQPIIRLYNEIRMNARKAYLYEFAGYDEYLSAYEAYKELCKRLEKSYGKSVTEVAAYIEESMKIKFFMPTAAIERTIRCI